MIVNIYSGCVNAKIANPTREIKLAVSDLLSYEVAGAQHSDKFKEGGWAGTASFFRMTDCSFPAGFNSYIKSELEKIGHKVVIYRKPLPAPLGPENPVVDNFPEDPRYDYQMDTVNRLLNRGGMIARIATGGGKSRISRLAYKRINRMTLFITTRGVLMYQMKDAFEEMGEKVGVIGDGQLSIKKGFNVGMVQTFTSMLKDPKRREKVKALLAKFEFVVLEEAHEISGDGFYEIMKHCKNAHYRLALTATPFLKTDGEANMRLRAAVGAIGIDITEKMLIDRSILAQPYFKFISADRPKYLSKSTNWKSAYRLGIVENADRNKRIVFEVKRAAIRKLRSIVLVQHQAHGKALQKMMTAAGIRCVFMFGEHTQEERRKAIVQLEIGEIDAIIGSKILDVGVDVPSIDLVILAGGGKAEVELRQRIGRGLRAKKVGGNVCFVADFTDDWNKHTYSHAFTRRQIVESIDGFKQGVLKAGEDFDFNLRLQAA